MRTPVCDFAEAYRASGTVRMHMPGHKGREQLGPEPLDLTEIRGAEPLYPAQGILRESEENAAALFGAARTVYSAEGSSLCIRAMLALALRRAEAAGLPRRILAGRNAHRSFWTAAALLDLDVDWIPPEAGDCVLSRPPLPENVRALLARGSFAAVWLTSPDYLGQRADVRGCAEACREAGVPLLADNAHGAYLRFIPEGRHPLAEGADLCCDSAHKTLPCLTGAAYLHVSEQAPREWREDAEDAMALFASTSPSWLILQSLDLANRRLAEDYPGRLAETVRRVRRERDALRELGWVTCGEEPMKLVLAPKARGLTGTELADRLRARGIEPEFADPDYVTLMPSPENTEEDWRRLSACLREVPQGAPLTEPPPPVPAAERVCSLRRALLSPGVRVPAERAVGRVLAGAEAACPPAVPVLVPGERITAEAVRAFAYYGIDTCRVLREG